ncbi:CidA/LrgA family protein [uncultured Lentibacter sp.]|uniref:CidA/LrgA family protein n=1 Tax=uncultured Lentibacter sp. TaxID=1659309 RepID=UPI002635103B|nr:CidA/LrgA family protein [uncultured Lentibacter sp.]MCW1955967.1 CidA/LrgA family protein [Roseobacter sp.]
MIGYLTLILSCQLAGEVVVGALGLPVPGPVLGMALLFGFLLLRGHVPDALGATADGLLRNMSLLFVPAGTGVIMHVALLSEALVPLSLAVAISTSAAIVVTALMMRLLSKGADRE